MELSFVDEVLNTFLSSTFLKKTQQVAAKIDENISVFVAGVYVQLSNRKC